MSNLETLKPCNFASRSVLFISDLLQLVEKRFVADLQLLRGPAPVPAGASQDLQDDFSLGFARGGARRIFERDFLAVAAAIDAPQKRAQSSHGERFIAQRDNGSSGVFQFANVSRPTVFQEEVSRLGTEDRYGPAKITGSGREEPPAQNGNTFLPPA